jgi:hypothetical protein
VLKEFILQANEDFWKLIIYFLVLNLVIKDFYKSDVLIMIIC